MDQEMILYRNASLKGKLVTIINDDSQLNMCS